PVDFESTTLGHRALFGDPESSTFESQRSNRVLADNNIGCAEENTFILDDEFPGCVKPYNHLTESRIGPDRALPADDDARFASNISNAAILSSQHCAAIQEQCSAVRE